MSREELEAEFASDDPERISNALFAAFYTEPPDVVERWCYRSALHPSEAARRGAAIVLGNTAVVHGLRDISFLLKFVSPAAIGSIISQLHSLFWMETLKAFSCGWGRHTAPLRFYLRSGCHGVVQQLREREALRHHLEPDAVPLQ
jgi:hypothetical protein